MNNREQYVKGVLWIANTKKYSKNEFFSATKVHFFENWMIFHYPISHHMIKLEMSNFSKKCNFEVLIPNFYANDSLINPPFYKDLFRQVFPDHVWVP